MCYTSLVFIFRLFINVLAVLVAAYILPGVQVEGFWAAFVTAIVLGIFNTVLRPILVLLTLPVTILTMGLFIVVINALLVMLADAIISGFAVENFWWALLFSFIVAIVGSFLGGIGKKGRHADR